MMFGGQAIAEIECGPYEATADVFVEAIAHNHPELTLDQQTTLAGIYESMIASKGVADDDSQSVVDRELAQRTTKVLGEMAAIQVMVFTELPGFEAIILKMQVEKESGLSKVSQELLPEVRETARTMLAIGLTWSELSGEVAHIAADRFMAATDQGATVSEALDTLEKSMCTLRATTDLMEGVAKIVPHATSLAFVENLHY